MAQVVALYRYPVKGLTSEACDTLTVLQEGRIAGDRALGFRFASSRMPDEAWSSKYEFVALVNTPGLARLDLRFDHRARRLRLSHAGGLLVEDALDPGGRKRIATALQKTRQEELKKEQQAQAERQKRTSKPKPRSSNRQSTSEAFFKSMARSLGSAVGSTAGRKFLRGVLGSLLK